MVDKKKLKSSFWNLAPVLKRFQQFWRVFSGLLPLLIHFLFDNYRSRWSKPSFTIWPCRSILIFKRLCCGGPLTLSLLARSLTRQNFDELSLISLKGLVSVDKYGSFLLQHLKIVLSYCFWVAFSCLKKVQKPQILFSQMKYLKPYYVRHMSYFKKRNPFSKPCSSEWLK